MANEGAAAALAAAVAMELRRVEGLSQVADGRPVRAGDAAATIDIGPETDWGHKTGAGAEIRFTVSIAAGGEDPARARQLRARSVREEGPRWRAFADYRARLLAT